MRINSRLIQESSRISKNHRELVRINENQGLDLFENQWESIPELFENQQESLRINNQWESIPDLFKNHWESSRIGENQWKSGFRLIWESMGINSRIIWESSRITENQESMRINSRLIQESLRISKNQWEWGFRLIRRINKNQFQTYLRIIENQRESENQWESWGFNWFTLIHTCKDLRIIIIYTWLERGDSQL